MTEKSQDDRSQEEEARTAETLSMLTQLLPLWYEKNKRSLPWRDTGDPYDVWISEIMLQQTRIEAVRSYFLRFRRELPDIAALAACPDDRLMKLWEGLGYYSRARNLKKCAVVLAAQYGGRLPSDCETLKKLPGIGPYTAGAIASIAFDVPVPAVDGNVLRVLSRILGDESDIALPAVKRKAEKMLAEAMRSACETSLPAAGTPFHPAAFNQALMELGEVICVPNGTPLCDACPVRSLCAAFQTGRAAELPKRSAKRKRRIEERTVVILRDGDRFFLRRRPQEGLLAGLYEFPSLDGFRTEKEVLAWAKALGLDPVRVTRLPDAKHIFTHVEWHMRGYLVKLAAESRISPDGAERLDLNAHIPSGKGKKEESSASGAHVFATKEETAERYALPSAFSSFWKAL